MTIEELTQKLARGEVNHTHEERVRMLKDAKIIDDDGYYHPGYFSEETVRKDRERGKPIKL